MKIVSCIKYLHISPKKIKTLGRAVIDLLPKEAVERLTLMENKGSRILAEAINSAMANATNNLKLDASLLRIKSVEVLKGPFLKRWQPVSRGMVHQIKKRTSHIKVILEEIKPKSEIRNSKQTEVPKIKNAKRV